MKLTIPCNVTGIARKRLVEDVSVALNTIPRYLGTPTMNYQIGDCLLGRNGTLTIPDMMESHTAQTLLVYLDEHGYEGEAQADHLHTESRLGRYPACRPPANLCRTGAAPQAGLPRRAPLHFLINRRSIE